MMKETKEDPIETPLDAITGFMEEGRKRDKKFIKTVGLAIKGITDETISNNAIRLSITETRDRILESVPELDLCPDCRSRVTKPKERFATKQ